MTDEWIVCRESERLTHGDMFLHGNMVSPIDMQPNEDGRAWLGKYVGRYLHSLRKACFDPEATRVIRKRRPGDRAPMPLPADARLLAPQEHLRERGDLAGVDDYWYACGSSQRDQTVEAFLANRPGLQVVRAIRRVGVDPDFRWIDQDELYNVKTDRFVGDVDQLLGEARSEPIDSRARFDWPIKGTGWARRVDAAGDIAWCCGLYERDRTEGVRCQRCGWPPSRHVGIRTAIFDLRGATPVRGVVVQLAFGRERLFTYEAAGRLVEGNMANFDHQNPWYRLATDNIDAGVVALNILPPPPVPDLHAAHRAKLARYRPGLLTQLQNVSDKVPRGPLWDELHDLVLQLGKVLPHAPPFIDRPPVEGGMTARLHDVPGVPPKPKPLEPRVDNMGSPWPEDDL